MDILIAKMQASYTAGQRSLRSRTKWTKRAVKFKRAISMVKSSGIPVDSDVQLAELFDQIVDTMHADALEDAQIDEDRRRG